MKRLVSVVAVVGVLGALAVVGIAQSKESQNASGAYNSKITEIRSLPPDALKSADAVWNELDKRLAEWRSEVGATGMSDDETVRNIDALRQALIRVPAGGDLDIWVKRELLERIEVLCPELSSGHTYRSYCPDAA